MPSAYCVTTKTMNIRPGTMAVGRPKAADDHCRAGLEHGRNERQLQQTHRVHRPDQGERHERQAEDGDRAS